jgi:hypothetical protein
VSTLRSSENILKLKQVFVVALGVSRSIWFVLLPRWQQMLALFITRANRQNSIRALRVHFDLVKKTIGWLLVSFSKTTSTMLCDAGFEIHLSPTDLSSPLPTQVKLEQFVQCSFWRNRDWARVPTILRWTPPSQDLSKVWVGGLQRLK